MSETNKPVELAEKQDADDVKKEVVTNRPLDAETDVDELKKMIRQLRKENEQRRVKLDDMVEKATADEKRKLEEKMIEEGKLKELLNEKEKELNNYKGIETKLKEYETSFAEQLDIVVKKLRQDQQELINDSGWALAKKMEWANKFLAQNVSGKEAPDTSRPGGKAKDIDIKLEDYQGAEGRARLIALRSTNPKLYELILNLKNQQDK